MEHKFYTKTLASLYAKQGYFEEAEKGFKYLLEKKPGQSDYLNELLMISLKKKEKQKSDLICLFSEWIGLLKQERNLRV